MTAAPYVELSFNPTDLRPGDLRHAGAMLGSPAEALEAALAVARARMITQMKTEIRGIAEPTYTQLLAVADLAWRIAGGSLRRVSAPVLADAYIRAYRAADAGDVPMSVIYSLADKHAEKVGDYFHGSSRQALAEGFNSLVNRQVPAKAAADRVLDAYGLTPRQMRGYVGAKQFQVPVADTLPRALKAKARAYIDRAFTTRTRKLARQEEHNIEQQAQQYAWMWLQDKGRLSQKAQKIWITARDERVCPVCGPLHGKKVPVSEQFVTKDGSFWTPGLHPNCRCKVRLLEHRFTKNAFGVVEKARGSSIDWDPKEHPRGGDPANRGRFSRVAYKEPSKPVIATGPVIETAPPVADISPVADIAPGMLRRVGVADISAPVDITTPLIDIAAPVADIGISSADILTGLPTPVMPPVVSDVEVIPNKPKKLVPYEQIRPLDEYYYKVVSGHPGFNQFDKEIFSADRDQVIRDAADMREAAIEEVMQQHVADGMVTYKEPMHSYGVPLEARIPAEEFRNILEVVAQHGTSEPPNDALIEVDYFDPDGMYVDAPIESTGRTVLDIAHSVGVDPDHLAVYVAKIDAVHAEEGGRGHAYRQQIVGHVYDEQEVTGEYAVNDYSPEYEDGTGTPNGVDIYYVEPHDPAIGWMEE
jgi:hypothetical protein